ncbi:MAG: hypothetical protein M1543_04000, partial [Firmicutes bacterium]|nr:hypothetical protein [Bacillota bacterium]
LLINLGFGSLDFALQLLRFWPVILIIIGLSLFGRGRINSWVAIVIVLALAGGVAAWLLLSAGHIPGKSV